MPESPRSQLNNNWFDPKADKPSRQPDVTSCSKCGCQWMELVQVNQYPLYHQVVLGGKPPTVRGPFYFFRCPKCMETFEPAIHAGSRDRIRMEYDQFVDHMQKDLEKEKKEGETV